jgi:hypothetical protein
MKKVLYVVGAMVLAGSAMALSGPVAKEVSVGVGVTDTTVVASQVSSQVVYVYCVQGKLSVSVYADGDAVNLVGGGSEMSATILVPEGANVPLYGKFDEVRITTATGSPSSGTLWQYKE